MRVLVNYWFRPLYRLNRFRNLTAISSPQREQAPSKLINRHKSSLHVIVYKSLICNYVRNYPYRDQHNFLAEKTFTSQPVITFYNTSNYPHLHKNNLNEDVLKARSRFQF